VSEGFRLPAAFAVARADRVTVSVFESLNVRGPVSKRTIDAEAGPEIRVLPGSGEDGRAKCSTRPIASRRFERDGCQVSVKASLRV
jgi:hypothetical protein